jgi:hypothetical protein
MANRIDISNENDRKNLVVGLRKAFQSANLNFLIGSGCSNPAIRPLGDIEKQIYDLITAGKELHGEICLYDFLLPIAESNNKVMDSSSDADTEKTLDNYRDFIHTILNILIKRKSNIHTKQATIFTTNYDLFIEKASESFSASLKVNDGFNRNPRLDGKFTFSAMEFFNAVYNKGNIYNYQVEIPTINLVKLHGSLSWNKQGEDITFLVRDYLERFGFRREEYAKANGHEQARNYIKDFNDQFQIVLPIKDKLRGTLLDRVYYNLLRIYANELDKENTLLVAEGISFEDEHISDITKKALRNPTLGLIVFCYQKENVDRYDAKFTQCRNVDIVFNEKSNLGFEEFNKTMNDVLSEDFKEASNMPVSQGNGNDAD